MGTEISNDLNQKTNPEKNGNSQLKDSLMRFNGIVTMWNKKICSSILMRDDHDISSIVISTR